MESIYTLITLLVFSMVSGHPSTQDVSILVDKPSSRLYVLGAAGDTIVSYPVALGCNYGSKQREGDRKTPDGDYEIVSVEDSHEWEGDASGSDYGPWFLRLGKGEWQHIGIHGTNVPESIGRRASLGCIRLHNSDLEQLKQMVKVGTKVKILPDTITTDKVYVQPPAAAKSSYKSAGKAKVKSKLYSHSKRKGKSHWRRHRKSRRHRR